MASNPAKAVLIKLGVDSPAVNSGAPAATPLPELRDKHGGRVHVVARTFWVDESDVPEPVKENKVKIGSQRFMHASGLHRRDGGIVRSVMAFQDRGDCAKFVILLAQSKPWAPKDVASLLRRYVKGMEVADGLMNTETTQRVGPAEDTDLPMAIDSSTLVSDTYTILGHCLSSSAAGARLKMLDYVTENYGTLLNTAVVIDKEKAFKPFHPEARNNFSVGIPYAGDACQEGLIERICPFVPRDDVPLFRDWVDIMAEERCSDKWPYRQEIHELVEHFRDALVGMSGDDELEAMMDAAARQKKLLESALSGQADLKAELDESVQAAAELRTQLSAADERVLAAENARKAAEQNALSSAVRAQQLYDENTMLKARLRGRVQRRQEESSAAVDVAMLQEELAAMRRAVHASENRARAVVALSRPAGSRAPLRAPEDWDELYACAARLQHVRMTYSAVEPALKDLVHHEHSANWLGRTWTVLVALDEYAALPAGKYLNFRLFCSENGRGKLTAAHVVLNEGEQVRNNTRMRAERTFSTESGPMEMFSHVRIGSGAPPAPRLHFRHLPEEGVVYVGYVGPHLTNTQTN